MKQPTRRLQLMRAARLFIYCLSAQARMPWALNTFWIFSRAVVTWSMVCVAMRLKRISVS